MRFVVFRTSQSRFYEEDSQSQPPCEGAVMDTAEGRPDLLVWYLDVPDLDALIAFATAQKHELVISTSDNWDKRGTPALEIYDDYRE